MKPGYTIRNRGFLFGTPMNYKPAFIVVFNWNHAKMVDNLFWLDHIDQCDTSESIAIFRIKYKN